MIRNLMGFSVLCLMFAFLISCGGSSSSNSSTSSLKKSDVIKNYSDVVLSTYQESLSKAQLLKVAIDSFVANPSEGTHLAAKSAWLIARIPYGQTEAFRFYGGPIDNEDTGPEPLINDWPMDEAHIDYVNSDTTGLNIINNLVEYPVLSKAIIENLNESGGEKNISVGYHAIEFLLWGQDLSVSGPGARLYTDFVEGVSGTNANQKRRKEYLSICAEALVDHLTYLVSEWSEGSSTNYRATFLALSEKEALLKIVTGIEELSFGELASERMNVALVNHDQEDEHSCFSDNTNIDILMNATGISNVILGKFVDANLSVKGSSNLSIYELLKTINPTKAEALKSKMESTLATIALIQAPFDQEVSQANVEGNARVKAGVTVLKGLNELITDAKVQLELE
jgi:putative iron-regulated protein